MASPRKHGSTRGRGFPISVRSAVALLALAAMTGSASSAGTNSVPPAEQRTATATVDAFNGAIERGETAAACALLMPAVVIFESGDEEKSADEYCKHHLPSDIAFMAGIKIERLSRHSGGDGTTSWVATKSRMHGLFKGKAVDLDSTESFVLTSTSAGWRIAHIHWSSSSHR